MSTPTKAITPAKYIASLAEPRRTEIKALHPAIRKAAPQLKPHVDYNGTILSYGHYHYRYTSGREGDCGIIGLSSRAQYISLYVAGTRNGQTIVEAAKKKLGKVSAGKVCIRFKKLADLNLPAALELVREASALVDNGSTDFSL